MRSGPVSWFYTTEIHPNGNVGILGRMGRKTISRLVLPASRTLRDLYGSNGRDLGCHFDLDSVGNKNRSFSVGEGAPKLQICW